MVDIPWFESYCWYSAARFLLAAQQAKLRRELGATASVPSTAQAKHRSDRLELATTLWRMQLSQLGQDVSLSHSVVSQVAVSEDMDGWDHRRR